MKTGEGRFCASSPLLEVHPLGGQLDDGERDLGVQVALLGAHVLHVGEDLPVEQLKGTRRTFIGGGERY